MSEITLKEIAQTIKDDVMRILFLNEQIATLDNQFGHAKQLMQCGLIMERDKLRLQTSINLEEAIKKGLFKI